MTIILCSLTLFWFNHIGVEISIASTTFLLVVSIIDTVHKWLKD